MSIFKEYDSGGKDRSAEDRRRHRELVEESIKKNIVNIIAEESIIGQSSGKKIKIPIRGIKEYQFVYGKNVHGAGSGDGDEKRGDMIGEDPEDGAGKGSGGAGDQEGEDIYEIEITIEELIKYLFDDLKLPDIDRRKLSELESDKNFRNLGYQKKGIPPRIAKKRSVIEKIKRRQGYLRSQNEVEEPTEEARFPFMEDDLRYRRLKEKRKKDFNAVVLCIMDVSGSMDQTKKYMARSFYFLLYQFLRLKYSNIEVVFIAHTTTAKEVNEREFFHKGESGGTYISSGYEKALEIIERSYNPANWNIYAFHCSDGDNWTEDNKKAIESAQKLTDVCNLFGYGEIVPGYYVSGSTIRSEFQKYVKRSNFVIVTIIKKEDILSGLKKLLEKDNE
jgi:sporulation protein YhbH